MKTQRILLILLLLFVAVTTWIWLTIDTQLPWWDQSSYLSRALQYTNQLKKLDLTGFYRDFAFFINEKPPFLSLITVPIYFLNYPNEDLAVMINVLSMAVALFAVFKICKTYFKTEQAVLSCFLLFMYPLICWLMRTYLIGITLMALVALSIYLLLKCDYFRNLKYSILFGLCLGIGVLTKQSYAFFMAGPTIYMLCKSKARLNVLYCAVAGLIVSLPWYIPNFKASLDMVLSNSLGEQAVRFAPAYLNNFDHLLLFYLYAIINHGVSGPFAFLFLFSVVFFAWNYKNDDIKSVFLWWMILPFLFHTFSLYKDPRRLVALFPAMAIITGYGIYSIKIGFIKRIIISFIILFGFLQFFVDSFDIPLLRGIASKKFIRNHIVYFEHRPWHRPVKEEWRVDEMFYVLKKDAESRDSKIMLISDHKAYNCSTLNYLAFKKKLPFHFTGIGWHQEGVVRTMREEDYDYLIHKNADNDAGMPMYKWRIDEAYGYVEDYPAEFKLMYEMGLMDGSNLLIYKRM